MYLLRQVDDFALAYNHIATAKEIYGIIGSRPRLAEEPVEPFSYLELVQDSNGVDIEQSNNYIQISFPNYIDRLLRSHGWEEPGKINHTSKLIGSLTADAIQHIYKNPGPAEGSIEHQALETKLGFGCRTLLGEMMYAYVTCRPHIGYAIITNRT